MTITCKGCNDRNKMIQLLRARLLAMEKRLDRAIETIKRHTDTSGKAK